MHIKTQLSNPLSVFFFSLALLLAGVFIGMRWPHTFGNALTVALLAALFMVIHAWALGLLYFWLSARLIREAVTSIQDTKRN